jgi:asparagine synthase (glutamine-hydrolysing)
VSDVPLGAFLSGGIDSSAVVGLMSQLTDQPVKTASIGFADSSFDETAHARTVARHFGTDAYERTVSADAVEILDLLVWHFDEPFADSSMVPTYYVSQVAREKVTVCLSGDGGDENFAGYRRYRFDLLENRLRSVLPEGIRMPIFGALGRMYPKADWLPRPLRAKTLLTNLSLPSEQGYFRTMSWFSSEMKRRLYNGEIRRQLGDYDSFSVLDQYFRRAKDWDPVSRIQYVDFKTYLVDDILTKVDRASMAHSLEVRVPLLDHMVVEYAATIPYQLKLFRGEGKYVFKQALTDLLPAAILSRKKMGFSIPLAEWFRRELKDLFEERVFSSDAFIKDLFQIEPIKTWWGQHQRRTRDYAYQLWAILILESWGQRFMRMRS